MSSPKTVFVASLSVSLALSAAGCAADAPEGSDPAEDGVLATSEDAITAEFVCDRTSYGRLDASPPRQGQLVAVRAGRPGNYDRFVLEFERGTEVPRFHLQKESDATFETIDGRQLRLRGTRGLSVVTSLASGWDMETGVATYTGPKRFTPTSTRIIAEAAQTEDFEATLSWGLGLTGPVCFRVTKLGDPPRLVVDVKRKL